MVLLFMFTVLCSKNQKRKLPFVPREEAHSSISISKAGTLFSEIYLFDKEA
jgi:hypothetical protein